MCSCGWVGNPVEPEHTVFVWMRHAEARGVDARDPALREVDAEAAEVGPPAYGPP